LKPFCKIEIKKHLSGTAGGLQSRFFPIIFHAVFLCLPEPKFKQLIKQAGPPDIDDGFYDEDLYIALSPSEEGSN